MELETADVETVTQLGGLIDRVSSLMDGVLGFTFELDPGTLTLDGSGVGLLYLPAPGAQQVMSIVENGVTLDPSDYALQRRYGQYIQRLGGFWTINTGGIVLTYLPSIPPPALEEICIEVCVKRWGGRSAGFTRVVGVEGSNERLYSFGFTQANLDDLHRISRDYGLRNLVAV
jgi:hypothetical protein